MLCLQQSKKPLINSNTSPALKPHKSAESLSKLSPGYHLGDDQREISTQKLCPAKEEALKAVAQTVVY